MNISVNTILSSYIMLSTMALSMHNRYFTLQSSTERLMILFTYTLYSVINATLHLNLRNFTSLPHNMFRPQ
jgi:hypothetical protein